MPPKNCNGPSRGRLCGDGPLIKSPAEDLPQDTQQKKIALKVESAGSEVLEKPGGEDGGPRKGLTYGHMIKINTLVNYTALQYCISLPNSVASAMVMTPDSPSHGV